MVSYPAISSHSVLDTFLASGRHAIYNVRRQLLGAFAKLRKAVTGFVMPVCPSAWKPSTAIAQNFMKFNNISNFRKSLDIIQDSLKFNKPDRPQMTI